jgi:branched-chain amino acid transport system substrate-binding protein
MLKKRRTKKLAGITLGTLLAFLMGGLTISGNRVSAAETSEVVIGSLVPFTGPNAAWGIRQDRGLRMMIERINAQGGIKSLKGAKIKYVVYDTESKPEVAGTQTEKMVTVPGLCLVTGAVQSPASVVASQVTERNQIPYIDTSGVDPLLTTRGFKYVFRTTSLIKDIAGAPLIFAEAMNKKHNTNFQKVGVLCEDTLPGKNMADALKNQTQKQGYTLVESVLYSADKTTDFVGILSRFKAKGVELFISHNKPADAVQITRNMKEVDFSPPMVAGLIGGWVAADYLPNVGSLAEGVVISSPESLDLDFPHYKAFREEYEKKHSDPIAANVIMGWSAAWVFADALERCGSRDPKEIAKALRNTDLKFGEGYFFQQFGLKFDETGENTRAASTITQIIEGKRLGVFPDVAKKREPVWPKPKFR